MYCSLFDPVAYQQGMIDVEFRQVEYMGESMAGQHIVHLLVELCGGDLVGILPFWFYKMDMAVPECGRQDQAAAVYDLSISRYFDLVRTADGDNFSIPDQDRCLFNRGCCRRRVDAGADQGEGMSVVVLLAKGDGAGEQSKD